MKKPPKTKSVKTIFWAVTLNDKKTPWKLFQKKSIAKMFYDRDDRKEERRIIKVIVREVPCRRRK